MYVDFFFGEGDRMAGEVIEGKIVLLCLFLRVCEFACSEEGGEGEPICCFYGHILSVDPLSEVYES